MYGWYAARTVKKTSLYLPPELDRALTRRAAEQGLSKAELMRGALAEAARPLAAGRVPRGRGMFEGPQDLAESLDRHLAELGFGEQ
jgi:hypothetical protein